MISFLHVSLALKIETRLEFTSSAENILEKFMKARFDRFYKREADYVL